MAHFIIENFANGMDVRRHEATAPPGSLRLLRNGFINEGGEIEKRKAFVRHSDLSDYGQTANYKGRITGPHPVPGSSDTVYYRHRHNSLPSSPWVAGTGTEAKSLDLNSDTSLPMNAWAMKSATALTTFGALFRANARGSFANFSHLVETWLKTGANIAFSHRHFKITFSGSEPTVETAVAANDDRPRFTIHRDKAYFITATNLYASAVGDPGDMAGVGSGNVDLRTQSPINPRARGIDVYFDQLAILGENGAQFWLTDPDFSKNQYLRTIPLSILAGSSLAGFGDGDLLYFAPNGVRSLQARDSSNLAKVTDVGSPIDKYIQSNFNYAISGAENTNGISRKHAVFLNYAKSIVHPDSGQFWLFLAEKVFVLSHYPAAGVRAWSMFDLPSTTSAPNGETGAYKCKWVADVCPIQDTLIFRNFNDESFIYGGPDKGTYDTSTLEVITPHHDFGKPGKIKIISGIDIICEGTWTVEFSTNPQNIFWEDIATAINGSSISLADKLGSDLECTHLALRFMSTSQSAAKLSSVIVYYEEGDER